MLELFPNLVHMIGMPNPVIATNGLNWQFYLYRQGRNEYITFASQNAYDGNNTAFIFFEIQIRRLVDERFFKECKLEVLRASCDGQTREMVNLCLLHNALKRFLDKSKKM